MTDVSAGTIDSPAAVAPKALEAPDALETPDALVHKALDETSIPAIALPPLDKPPLDPRVLRNFLVSYDGDTVALPQCDLPVFHGHGVAVFRTGFTYSGMFHYGRQHGRGRIEWDSGIVYEGDFVDNEMIGHGSYSWPNGSSYVGDIVRGRRHGHGVFYTGTRGTVTLPVSGDAGESSPPALPISPLPFSFHGDETSGAAIEGVSNARYEGQWVDGQPHGRGVLVFDVDQHVRYEGAFVAGKRHGHGEMRYASGNVYTGEWESDTKSGHGTMLWMAAAGSGVLEKYDGQWRDDRPHGHGRHVWLGAARQHQREKNWYEGDFADGVRHGRGAFYYANGARYEGEWVDNVKHGTGLFFYEDGRVFVGEFRNDRSLESSSNDQGQTTSSKILLFVNDLLPQEGRDKAQKLVENAVLRLNTELRALYRQYIAVPTPGSPTRASVGSVKAMEDSSEATAVLMEFYECRRLLADCGLKLSAGHLERHLQCVRDAQRLAVVPVDGVIPSVHVTDAVTLAASLHEIVPPSRLLLFREFVELLVRLAYDQQQRDIENDGAAKAPLADAFLTLYDRLVRARQHRMVNSKAWTSTLEQLHSEELPMVYQKHHAALQRLFLSCDKQKSDTDPDAEPAQDDTTARPLTVSVRSLLARLHDLDVFTPSFRVRHALLALQEAFSLDDEDGDIPSTIDPFYVETHLLFTDFLDAIAIVLFTKQQQKEQGQTPSVGTPLFALVDAFLHSLPSAV